MWSVAALACNSRVVVTDHMASTAQNRHRLAFYQKRLVDTCATHLGVSCRQHASPLLSAQWASPRNNDILMSKIQSTSDHSTTSEHTHHPSSHLVNCLCHCTSSDPGSCLVSCRVFLLISLVPFNSEQWLKLWPPWTDILESYVQLFWRTTLSLGLPDVSSCLDFVCALGLECHEGGALSSESPVRRDSVPDVSLDHSEKMPIWCCHCAVTNFFYW
jgi:hypothetical protein